MLVKKKNLRIAKFLCASIAFIEILTFQVTASSIKEDISEIKKVVSSTASRKILSKDSETGTIRKFNIIGVALFSGKDLVSKTIKTLTQSRISHVGMIVADADDENSWYCFESTGHKHEVLKGKYPHVRMTPWDSVVRDYEGKISYRLTVFDEERVSSLKVTKFIEDYNGKSYTKNLYKLLKALWRKNKYSHLKVLRTVFCSQLDARMLMELGIIFRDVAANFLPKDFEEGSKFLRLKPGVTFSPAFHVK